MVKVKTNKPQSLCMNIEERIKELGIKLPEAPGYKGNYIGAKWAGNIAFSCGQGPFKQLNTEWWART